MAGLEANVLQLRFNNDVGEFEAVVAQAVDDEDGSLYMSLLDTAWKTQRRGTEIVFMFPQTDWDQFTEWCGSHSLSVMKLNESEWRLDTSRTVPGRARSVCSETDRNVNDTFLDRAADLLRAGQSMFITGEGGSGKSYLAWRLYLYAATDLKWEPERLAVTAYTGVAAQELLAKKPADAVLAHKVSTLHAFMGVMPGMKTAEQLQTFIEKNPELRARWSGTFMLIIDEISMVDAGLFTMLYETRARFNPHMVIVCLGDFCQLPPQTIERRDVATNQTVSVPNFCFHSAAWETLIGRQRVIILTTNYRVDADRDWRKLLKRMRLGHQTEQDRQFLIRMADREITDTHVHIYCRRSQVKDYNQRYFASLINDGRSVKTYKLQWLSAELIVQPQTRLEMVTVLPLQDNQYPVNELVTDFMKKMIGLIPGRAENECLATEVTLCVGARVMYERNLLDEGLGNGMQGVVTGLEDDCVYVLFENQDSPTRVNFMEHAELSEVLFRSTETARIHQQYRVKCRLLPLQLAGAITVHKAQGMTLDKVYVKLYDENMVNGRLKHTCTIDFPGQVYVALSRGRCSANMVVHSDFGQDHDWARVKPHPDVVSYYGSLNDVTPARATTAPQRTRFGNLLDPRWLHRPLMVRETPLFILYQREKEFNKRLAEKEHDRARKSKKK